MYKFCGNRGKFLNFVGIGGICNTHHWLRGNGRPWRGGIWELLLSPVF